MRHVQALILVFAILSLTSCTTYNHESENYNIPPKGYVLGFTQSTGLASIDEYVPKGQTVHNWNEMLTLQSMSTANNNLDAEALYQMLALKWRQECPNASVKKIESGVKRNFPYVLGVFKCPKHPSTNKPENTIVKVLNKNNKFFFVQKAAKFELSEQYTQKWLSYVRSIVVY